MAPRLPSLFDLADRRVALESPPHDKLTVDRVGAPVTSESGAHSLEKTMWIGPLPGRAALQVSRVMAPQ